MNFTLPKKLRTPLKPISVYMSSTSRPTNHYQTLNVNPNATQEEIKTAYYKLTKKFHPDVNKTEEAKKKFRDISVAYEIIGNYKSRRQYDRGMIVGGSFQKPTETDEKEPEHMAFYRSRMRSSKKPVQTADSKIYDFDAWTRAHYGQAFQRTMDVKQTNINAEILRRKFQENKQRKSKEFTSIVAFVIVTALAMALLERDVNFDNVAVENSEKSIEESNQKH